MTGTTSGVGRALLELYARSGARVISVNRRRVPELESRYPAVRFEHVDVRFNDEVERIEADQKRLRENIEALSKTPEAKTLIARYIAKAGEQESRLEEVEKQRGVLEAQRTQLQQEQAAEVRDFELK